MEKKKRIAALLLAVTVLLVMLYSALFIAAEADHDCVGENCPICYQINVCQNALKNLSLAVCAAVFAAALPYPNDYPELGSEITVTGTFEVYTENGFQYCRLVDATLVR